MGRGCGESGESCQKIDNDGTLVCKIPVLILQTSPILPMLTRPERFTREKKYPTSPPFPPPPRDRSPRDEISLDFRENIFRALRSLLSEGTSFDSTRTLFTLKARKERGKGKEKETKTIGRVDESRVSEEWRKMLERCSFSSG